MATAIVYMAALAMCLYKVYHHWVLNMPVDVLGDFLLLLSCSSMLTMTADLNKENDQKQPRER